MFAARNLPLLGAAASVRVEVPMASLFYQSFLNVRSYSIRTPIFWRACVSVLAVFGLAIASTTAAAQWTAEGANFVGRYKAWKDAPEDPYSPGHAIGASSLAFGPDDALFLACEKYPDLLIFAADGSKPRRVRLEGVLQSKGQPDVDLGAMSIHNGNIFLFDEDKLVIYVTPVDRPGRVTKLDLVFDSGNRIDNRSTTDNPSDHSSVEGIVVTDTFFGAKAYGAKVGAGPYFYLLDERDDINGRKEAKLYLGVRNGNQIQIAKNVIAFDLHDESGLTEGFRLTELFEYRGALYAMKTRRPQKGKPGVYKVVRCDLEARQLSEICDFSVFASDLKTNGYDNNCEGAAVAPDGRLFLTADNESLETGGHGPPPMRDAWRGVTPIVSLRLQP